MKIRPGTDVEAWSESWMLAAHRARNRWQPVVAWAFKHSGKRMPRRKGLVLRLAELAIRAECQRVVLRYWLHLSPPGIPKRGLGQ